MSDNTKIQWADATWNPITGCAKISQGCKNCYAAELHDRRHKAVLNGAKLPAQYAKPFSEIQLFPERLDMPLHWKKPRRIFVNSTSDLFHEDVPFEFIDLIGRTVSRCAIPHIFMILTKRPDRMQEYFSDRGNWTNNVWLGISAEDQKAADERIPLLLQTPAAVRFVSCEPLLGLVDLTHVHDDTNHTYYDVLGGSRFDYDLDGFGIAAPSRKKLDWVIVGGESGPNARPMHPDWARLIRDQCVEAGVPFFFKQWGEHLHESQLSIHDKISILGSRWCDDPKDNFHRVGKKHAGRVLDGREWNEYPETIK